MRMRMAEITLIVWMRMPSNAKIIHKCKHQQWPTCKANDVIGTSHNILLTQTVILLKSYYNKSVSTIHVYNKQWFQGIHAFDGSILFQLISVFNSLFRNKLCW